MMVGLLALAFPGRGDLDHSCIGTGLHNRAADAPDWHDRWPDPLLRQLGIISVLGMYGHSVALCLLYHVFT